MATSTSGKLKIIAVDGPAGSGKSSVCSEVAKRIGWSYINTGAIYRAVGLLAKESGVDLSDEQATAQVAKQAARDLTWDEACQDLCYKGDRLGSRLYSQEASEGASITAKMPEVRDVLLPLQRQLVEAAEKGAIVDGRDIGTVVFPDAALKIFLTASLEERAKRRLQQMREGTRLAEIMKDIATRDDRDSARGTAPLKIADDAVVVDSSEMDRDAVIQHIIQLLEERGLLG